MDRIILSILIKVFFSFNSLTNTPRVLVNICHHTILFLEAIFVRASQQIEFNLDAYQRYKKLSLLNKFNNS